MNDFTPQERLHSADLAMPAPSHGDTLDIVEYWHAISKRRWSILGLTIIVAVLSLLVVHSIRPTYRGTATLLIEQGKTKIVSIEDVYNQGLTGNREYFQTQADILKSDELARKTVEKLKLVTHPDYDPRQKPSGAFSWLTQLFTEPKPATDEAILKNVTRKFKKDLEIQLIRNSQLVQISFTSYDKDLAAKVPNTLADVYIENDLDARAAMTERASEWLRNRLGELKSKVDVSEKALQDYRDRANIVDTKGLALSGATKQLEELTRTVVDAHAKRAEAESAYQQVLQVRSRGGHPTYETIPAVVRNPLVQKLKEAEGDSERKFSDAAKRYGPEHPKLIQARAELDAARRNTQAQIDVVVQGLAKEYDAAKANEAAVERALAQSKGEIQNINRKEFQLGILERDVQQNRNLYEMFVNRLKETSVGSEVQSTIARVVDPAIVPGEPYAPKKVEIVGIATALALIITAMLALLLDRLNNTVNSTGDVESRLGVPALGVLQKVKGFTRKGFVSELAFFNDTQSTFAEAVRTVRTSVLMSALDHPHKVVVVTSSVPEEGKTTLSFNLSCALGQVKKVLLVDGDLRRPKIGKLVGRDNRAPGLADLVAGQAQVSQCVFFDDKSGVHILAAGTVPPNPLELLSSKRFEDVITKLKDAFDIVVVDSAPLQLVSDAQILSQFASEVIYVVKADATPYQVAQNGIKKLRRVNAPILGVVLNQLDLEKAEKYYGEYSGYRSYKGYRKHGYSKTYGQAD